MPPRTRAKSGVKAAATANPPAQKPAGTKGKGTKRKAAPAKKQASKKAAKSGLSGTPAPQTDGPLRQVDPAANLSGKILVVDGIVHDVMLNLRDISKNMDKFYILQAVECDDGTFVVYTRWGRTGTSGSCQKEVCDDEDAAVAAFSKTFNSKTGTSWEIVGADPDAYDRRDGKYEWAIMDHQLVGDLADQAAKWQYWVDDGVAGKADGWYDYEEEASAVVENLFYEFSCNAHMNQRVVASGEYEYLVDLATMQQTNVTHENHTMRHIRRWTPALGADQTPPGKINTAAAVSAAGPSAAAAATPTKAQVKAAIKKQMQTPVKTPVKTPIKTPVKSTPMTPATPKVDPSCQLLNASVHEDYSVMLNQTNLSGGANNNKFYRIQLLHDAKLKSKNYFVWTRWGRVGENGQSKLDGGFAIEDAVIQFGKKFQAKTGNKWENRDSFAHVNGKYDLVETAEGDATPAKPPAKTPASHTKPSTLDPVTEELVEFIFSSDMFNSAMAEFEIDVQKMPLGQLSQAQVQKGYDVLLELEEAIKQKRSQRNRDEIEALTARFYTVIPHSFGRQRPPLIDTAEKVAAKIQMCDVLSDIETAQELLKDHDAAPATARHPADELYDSLQAKLKLVSPSSAEHKTINNYFKATMGQHQVKLLNVWSVGRKDEDNATRTAFCKLDNHKLLWHGTNIAVVAAILKSGLRIMPHSGGRVGKGIYLASEHAKSSWYVSPGLLKGRTSVGVMFLAEAALGKQHVITQDDSSIVAPPKGFDSVLAKGRQEPDPKMDTTLVLDGIQVAVPQGKPAVNAHAKSSFDQSEYLVYTEKQQRLRYMLTFQW